MGQEGDAAEHKRIPKGNGMVLVHLMKEERFQAEVKGDKVRSGK
jgi:hypothetical protein